MDPPNKKRRLAPKTAPVPPALPVGGQSAPAPLNAPAADALVSPARVEFERFARHLQDAAMLIQRSAERPPYTNVSVLLLRWEEDTSVESELLSLERVLRETYNYRTDRWNIPTVPNPSIKLGVQMASFLENARSDHLLIIYYAGHGYVGPDNQLYWACNPRDDAYKLKWDGVRCLFEDAQSDILLFLDSCAIQDAPLAGSHGVKQAIAARGTGQSPQNGGRSFTSILIEVLHKFGSAQNPLSVQALYEEILGRKHGDLAQPPNMTNGVSKAQPLATQLPVQFTLTPGKGQSITLSPLPSAPQVLSPQKTDGEADHGAARAQEQAIDPEAVLELKFNEPRVLACTTFVGEASSDMAFFNRWLEDMPAIADSVNVEAMFFGPPTMLLISMAHSLWEIVRHDKVCIFLGYIGSHNFVHLYQRLVGYVGSQRVNKATAKEVEDGRILLEAREAAASAKRAQRDADGPETPYRKSVRDGTSQDGPGSAEATRDYGPARFTPAVPVKDELEDSAVKEAAEQLKALSHIRHLSDETPADTVRRRSTLPDSAPDRHDDTGSSNGANESGADDSMQAADYSRPTPKLRTRRAFQKPVPKQETQCSHCSHAPFKDSSSLRKHIAAAHTRPFPCAFSFAGCTSTFGSKNEWKRHISSQHLCLQYYRCSACPASASEGKFNEFNRKDLFTQHLRRMHAPFAVKKSIAKGDSKLQLEWEAHVKDMQQSCLVQRRQPPQRSACPKPDCQNIFEGPGSWDEWTEHVGRHMEKNEGQRLGVDRHLAKWALEEGIIERDEDGEYKLVPENGIGVKGVVAPGDYQVKDNISVVAFEVAKKERDSLEPPAEGDSVTEKMDVDE